MMIRLSLVLLTLCVSAQALGRTLEVGEGKEFEAPSAAARVAEAGDRIRVFPGTYYDCVIANIDGLTIEGVDAPEHVILTDTTCQGKALLVLQGKGMTVRGLTLTRARVPDGNGAGIRAEGRDLTVEKVRFINNQSGLLSGISGGTIRLSDCVFSEGGGPRMSAVLVGGLDRLVVERGRFSGMKGGQVSSGAARTDLTGNDIVNGGAAGLAPGDMPVAAVVIAAGALTMEKTTITLTAGPPRLETAVLAMDGGPVTLRGNQLVNKTGRRMTLLVDWTNARTVLEGNTVAAGDDERSTRGLARHRASGVWHGSVDTLRHTAGAIKRGLSGR